jgi:hypothetical protein
LGAALGYEKGFDRTRVEYVDVPGPVHFVDVPGQTIVKKLYVTKPRYCPAQPSVADALNEYEAISRP